MSNFIFNQELANYLFSDRNIISKKDKLVVLLLYKAVKNPKKINFKILYKILHRFLSTLIKIVDVDRDWEWIDIESMIYKLWILYSNRLSSISSIDDIDDAFRLTRATCNGIDNEWSNMRDLILRIIINTSRYLRSIYKKRYHRSVLIGELISWLNKHDETVEDDNIASIVCSAVESLYPQCNYWVGDEDGWVKFVDRFYPGHSKLMNDLDPNNDYYWHQIKNGYMPPVNIDDIEYRWHMIKNNKERRWLGFNLKPWHNIILCKNYIFIVSNYDDDISGWQSCAAWVRENHEWKFQPIMFWN